MTDRIVLECAGPPTYTRPHDALHLYTLPQVLALFLHTRRWQREEEADRIGLMLDERALHGSQAQKAADELVRRSNALRRPEIPPAPLPLTDIQRRMLGLAGEEP